MHRVNFGNGQISGPYRTKASAEAELRRLETGSFAVYAWLQKYESGSADDPGEWVTAKRTKAT